MFLLSTGIFIPLTPGYVISINSFPVPRGLAGELFCRVLSSRHAFFTLGKISILKVSCLVPRGTVFFDPLCTSATSPERRCFFTSWLSGFALVFCRSTNFLSGNCQEVLVPKLKRRLDKKGTQAMIVINSLIGFYFPCLITWASFAHITLLFKTSPMARCCGERQRAQQRAFLRMCAVTSITLTLCWLPSQTIYVLSPFGVTQIGSTLHRAGEIVAMFNSCVNPLIYWMTNSEYRVGLKCFRKKNL